MRALHSLRPSQLPNRFITLVLIDQTLDSNFHARLNLDFALPLRCLFLPSVQDPETHNEPKKLHARVSGGSGEDSISAGNWLRVVSKLEFVGKP